MLPCQLHASWGTRFLGGGSIALTTPGRLAVTCVQPRSGIGGWNRRPAAEALPAGGRSGSQVGGGDFEPGFEKSTVGTWVAPAVAWKYFRSLAPVTLAVNTAGNRRIYALYDLTASL